MKVELIDLKQRYLDETKDRYTSDTTSSYTNIP